ncbi:MAG: hypothetical protein RSE29_13300 [Leclercia sp.]
MKKQILATTLITLVSAALVGCGDKQPDCASEAFSNAIIDRVGENSFLNYRDSDIKFSDKDDFIARNHIELRNIKEVSANEKAQMKTCSFDISIQPVGPLTSRFESKNHQASVVIDNNGKEAISAASNLGHSLMEDAELVERGKPTKEQQEALVAFKKQEGEKEKKAADFKNQVLAVPAAEFKFISEPDLTWLYLARAENIDNKEMLKLVDAQYYNEQDEFKKRDMEKTAIPAMLDKMKEYKQVKYIKLVSPQGTFKDKFTTISGDPVMERFLPGVFPEKYNFEKQVYPLGLDGCPDVPSIRNNLANMQSVMMEWDTKSSLTTCEIKPKDEDEARAWNEIFQAERYQSSHNNYGVVYFALNDELESGHLQATLVRADVNYNGEHPLKLTTR